MIDGDIPVLVRVISVLDYISVAGCIFISVLFFTQNRVLDLIPMKISQLSILGSDIYLTGGIVFVFTAVFVFFLAMGLWKGKNWARYIEIVLAVIGFVTALFLLIFKGEKIFIVNLVVHGLIGGYLMFNQDVRDAFY
jgi:ABC-type enterochelin transport system permease subunit